MNNNRTLYSSNYLAIPTCHVSGSILKVDNLNAMKVYLKRGGKKCFV